MSGLCSKIRKVYMKVEDRSIKVAWKQHEEIAGFIYLKYLIKLFSFFSFPFFFFFIFLNTDVKM